MVRGRGSLAAFGILAKWSSAYPTNAHERAGKTAGLPADKVEAILAGLPTSFTGTREQIIYDWRRASPTRAGYRRASSTAPSPPSATSAKPTSLC